jgi:nitroimidazol reductase NimA-like FMN-containing flavoprotein (pyridoxamine 5'-phosphate oxidase superfamily)
MDETRGLVHLDASESWALLHRSGLGVLATAADGDPDLYPLNYLVDGSTLVFRTAPGSKLRALHRLPACAFAAVGRDAEDHWSVVMRGPVSEITDQAEIVRSGAWELVTWAPGDKNLFLRLTPTTVEGRRATRAAIARAPLDG